jgi:hypothetical protein
MTALLFIVIVIVVLALALYAVDLAPLGDGRLKNLIKFLFVVIAIVVIVARFQLLGS